MNRENFFPDSLEQAEYTVRVAFESLEQYVMQEGDPILKRGRQEMLESILHSYV